AAALPPRRDPARPRLRRARLARRARRGGARRARPAPAPGEGVAPARAVRDRLAPSHARPRAAAAARSGAASRDRRLARRARREHVVNALVQLGLDARTTSVATSMIFQAEPAEVWERLMFYEQIHRRPPLHLRLLL